MRSAHHGNILSLSDCICTPWNQISTHNKLYKWHSHETNFHHYWHMAAKFIFHADKSWWLMAFQLNEEICAPRMALFAYTRRKIGRRKSIQLMSCATKHQNWASVQRCEKIKVFHASYEHQRVPHMYRYSYSATVTNDSFLDVQW